MAKNNTPLEYYESIKLADYLRSQNIMFTHIHNEMYTKSWKQKNKAKALGVSSGVPDYMAIIGEKLVFIELKREKGGIVSDSQKKWLESLNKCDGINAFVCKGFEETKKLIEHLIDRNGYI